MVITADTGTKIPPIERMDGMPFGRAYKVTKTEGKYYLPSVTTVLKMKKVPEYEAMKLDLGEDGYAKMLNRKAERGTVMHRWLELFLERMSLGHSPQDALLFTQSYISVCSDFDNLQSDREKAMTIGRNLFYNFYNARFWEDVCDIKKVMHNELFMFTLFKGGWAGATDLVFEDSKGRVVIADYKSSTGPKDEDNIDTYKMQIAAYVFKYAEMYGVIPDRGEILVSNESFSEVQRIVVPYKSDDPSVKDVKYWLREFLMLKEEFHRTPEWVEFAEGLASSR